MSDSVLAALRVERAAVLEFVRAIPDERWAEPSKAAGWSVRDVVVHLVGEARMLMTPDALLAFTSGNIERLNDRMVARDSLQVPAEIVAAFERWSGRAVRALTVMHLPLVGAIPLRTGELGWYPMRSVSSMFLYEWHTHVRYDLAPALGVTPPPTDAARLAGVVTWLLKLLEQTHRRELDWLNAPVHLSLTGPGGGGWRIERTAGALRVTPGESDGEQARIVGKAIEFPEWVTCRAPWQDRAITLRGDSELGARFLSSLNVV